MMTPEEKKEFTTELSKQFVLIPQSRWWHFLGGAATFVVAAFAMSYAGFLVGMKSDKAVQAAKRIGEIRFTCEDHLKHLNADNYVKYDDSAFYIVNADTVSVLTAGSEGKFYCNHPSTAESNQQKWTLRPYR